MATVDFLDVSLAVVFVSDGQAGSASDGESVVRSRTTLSPQHDLAAAACSWQSAPLHMTA